MSAIDLDRILERAQYSPQLAADDMPALVERARKLEAALQAIQAIARTALAGPEYLRPEEGELGAQEKEKP